MPCSAAALRVTPRLPSPLAAARGAGEPWASAATSLFPAAVTLGSAGRKGLMASRNAIYVVPSRAKKKKNYSELQPSLELGSAPGPPVRVADSARLCISSKQSTGSLV